MKVAIQLKEHGLVFSKAKEGGVSITITNMKGEALDEKSVGKQDLLNAVRLVVGEGVFQGLVNPTKE